MGFLQSVITILALVGVVGVVGYVAYCYLTAPAVMTTGALKPEDPPITRPATTMDKLSYATKRSGTLFVSLVMGSLVTFGNALLNMADFFNAPEVRTWVTTQFTPEVGSAILVIFLLITTWARVRNAFGK